MSDTLKELEVNLQGYKDKYKKLKEYFSSEESMEGSVISSREKARLEYIEYAIDKITIEIQKRKKLLASMNMQKVFNHYTDLLGTIDKSYKDANTKYISWDAYISTVGNTYSTAYQKFEDAINSQNKYKEDLANIAASVISVSGLGFLSWVSTTTQIADKLISVSDTLANVAEDVGQGAWDKAVSYSASPVNSMDIKNLTPIVFQNNIIKQTSISCKNILDIIGECSRITQLARRKLLSFIDKGIGENDGSKAAQKEYDNFLKIERATTNSLTTASKWIKETPPSINSIEVAKDLERSFWAKWIPRLRTHKIIKTDGEWGKKNEIEQINTTSLDPWLCTEVTNRLESLIDLEKIGVGVKGLKSWISYQDIRLLISWAKKFKPVYKF